MCSFLLLLCLSGTARAVSAIPSPNGTSSSAQEACAAQVRTSLSSVNVSSAKALDLATTSASYQSFIRGSSVQYMGYSLGYKISPACEATSITVDLNFMLNGTQILLVSENPTTTDILNAYIQPWAAHPLENIPTG